MAECERADGGTLEWGCVGKGLRRRGILAAAGAALAGIVAKQAAAPAAAANGNLVVLGSDGNIATAETGVLNSGPASPGGPAIHGFRSPGAVIVVGTTVNAGVIGQTFVTDAPGVQGRSPNGAQAKGVHGISNVGFGVFGQSSSGIGVQGQCDASIGIGVQGSSNLGVGVFGASNGNAGVLGITTAPGNAGLGGITNIAGTAAFAGTSTNPAAFAGFFTGDVFVNGNFTVQDPTRKHGAIQHPADPAGTFRTLYSMECPEPWLEDFGAGQLVDGKAEVALDAVFAAVIHTDDYHVFITSHDPRSQGVAVAARRGDGFTAQEHGGGTSGGTFSWRVVARPRSEHTAERLAKVVAPKITLPDIASLPKQPGPQKKP